MVGACVKKKQRRTNVKTNMFNYISIQIRNLKFLKQHIKFTNIVEKMNIENWKRKTNMTSEQFALGKLFFMNQLSEETLELKNVTTNNLTTLGVKFQRDKKNDPARWH